MPASVDYSKYPLFYKSLTTVGLDTPWEQYTLYGSIVGVMYASIKPFRKGYYLSKYLHEANVEHKIIWMSKGGLLDLDLKAGELYATMLKRTPMRLAMIPITFLAVEALKMGYRNIAKMGKNLQH